MKNWYMVCYDIRDPGRLRAVQQLMRGYGTRVQYSIFRCHLTERDVSRLRWELSKIINPEDELLIAQLCKSCVEKLEVHSMNVNWPKEEPSYEIL
jgi:CRISPR-associated protein Cas2